MLKRTLYELIPLSQIVFVIGNIFNSLKRVDFTRFLEVDLIPFKKMNKKSVPSDI